MQALYYVCMTTRGGVNISKADDNKLEQGVPPLLMGAKKSRFALSPFLIYFFLLYYDETTSLALAP